MCDRGAIALAARCAPPFSTYWSDTSRPLSRGAPQLGQGV